MKAHIALLLCLSASPVGAQEVLELGRINEMCGPKYGHNGWVDQTNCVLTVLPRSNNPDLTPSNPLISAYASMARKMIDDVKNKRISENDARENVQEAYHEALMHEQQDETKPVGKTYWTNERLNGANSVEFFKSDGDRITFSDSVSFVVLDLDTSDAAFPTYKVKVDAPFGPYYVSIREDEFRKDLTNTDGQRIFASQPPPKPPANVSGSGNVAMATSDYRAVFSFFLILFFIGVYMMPTMVARRNNHLNTAAICALNILLGWTFLGWVVALVWALTKSGAQAQRG